MHNLCKFCLSLSFSLALSEVLLFLPGKQDTVQTPLKTEEGFHVPPVSAPHVVIGSVLAKPQAARRQPSVALPLAGNAPAASAYTPRGKAGSAPCHLRSQLHPLHPSFASLSFPSPTPKSRRFLFFEMRPYKIILGKLTTLPLPFPPTSEKKEHLEALGATS